MDITTIFAITLVAIALILTGVLAARRYEFNESFSVLCWGILAIATFGIWIPIPWVRWAACGVYALAGSAFVMSGYLHTVNADEHRRRRQAKLNRDMSKLFRVMADTRINTMENAAKRLE